MVEATIRRWRKENQLVVRDYGFRRERGSRAVVGQLLSAPERRDEDRRMQYPKRHPCDCECAAQ